MFILQQEPIHIEQLKAIEPGKAGALVSFEGIVRADIKDIRHVASLFYIADAAACQNEGSNIIQEALTAFPLERAVCVQRIGSVAVGEPAIWIGVWSGHRDEAFKGCRYVIEEIKKRLLIWKKEFYTDGTSQWIHGAETRNLSL